MFWTVTLIAGGIDAQAPFSVAGYAVVRLWIVYSSMYTIHQLDDLKVH